MAWKTGGARHHHTQPLKKTEKGTNEHVLSVLGVSLAKMVAANSDFSLPSFSGTQVSATCRLNLRTNLNALVHVMLYAQLY